MGAVFTGIFWMSFQDTSGTQLNFNTTYLPDTNGQIEILEDLLRMYVMDQHK
jgi:hypothetical protein